MVTRLLLSDGDVVYSNFASAEERSVLRQRLAEGGLTMRCSCRSDEELLYGVSADNRIYPLHTHYVHAQWCSRCQNENRVVASTYDEEGNTTVYLKFDPKVFTPPREVKKEVVETPDNEKDDATESVPAGPSVKKKEKLPSFSLRQLVQCINRDTYSKRIMSGKSALLSEEYFMNALLSHLKKVYVSGMTHSLRDLSLEADHISFFYSKVVGIERSALYLQGSQHSYRRFVLEKVMERAREEFLQLYGVYPDEVTDSTVYAAGFAYKRISGKGTSYTCVGRLCFFLVSKNGLYAGSLYERDTLDALLSYTTKCGGVFLFPDSDAAPYFGVFRIPRQNKEGYVYLHGAGGGEEVALVLSDVPTREQMERFVENICF